MVGSILSSNITQLTVDTAHVPGIYCLRLGAIESLALVGEPESSFDFGVNFSLPPLGGSSQ